MAEQQIQHWHKQRDANDIVWLHLDRSDASVNTLSSVVLQEFEQLLYRLEQQTPAGVVILSDKRSGFIAGADVKEFCGRSDEDDSFAYIRYCQSLFDRLEALPCPTLALIHGFCMGGGTELALACDYRVGLDESNTRIGLPEIKLGIHPAYGGSVRSTRLLGPLTAMDIMLSGQPVSARTAHRIGLLDYVVPQQHLLDTARSIIKDRPVRKPRKLLHRLLSLSPLRSLLAWQLRRQVMRKTSPEHYPAPYALIDLWQKYAGSDEMMKQEARSVARLMSTPTAQNLIRVFFLQAAMKESARQSKFRARHVHVIGSGTMGGDIAAWCASRGISVTLQDQSSQRIAPAIQRAARLFKKELNDSRQVSAAMERLIADPVGDGLARADVIIEAIFEDLEVKQQLYKQIEPIIKDDALICSNTSSIPLQELGHCLNRPERLVGLHFFSPVDKMQLVEIVHADNTANNIINDAAAFTAQIGKLPLKVKSSPGFLVNRVLSPYLLEAAFMVQEGIDPALIDCAAIKFGMSMGPLELADRVGLDICLSVAKILTTHLGGNVPDILNDYATSGYTGVKGGRGFYEYRQGKPVKQRVDDNDKRMTTIQDRLILRLLNEAVACLREGIVDSEDMLDAGMIFGAGFAPFTGGPLTYLRTLKPGNQKRRFEEFYKIYGDRFIMDKGWENLLCQKY